MLHFIFAGNPGVGKSTLMNQLIGREAFKSGVSYGTGMTFQLDKVVEDGITYCDTPGLADRDKRQQAAEAIEAALKQSGHYKIAFIVTLSSGRVRPEDAFTISTVLKACPSIGNNYGILLNKVAPKQVEQLKKNLHAVTNKIFVDNVTPTAFVGINPLDPDLDEEENAVKPPPEALAQFFQGCPVIAIEPSQVSEINVKDFDSQMKVFEELIEALERDKQRQEERMVEQAQMFKDQIEDIQTRADQQMAFLHEQRKLDQEESAKRRKLDQEAQDKERQQRLEEKRLEVEERKRSEEIRERKQEKREESRARQEELRRQGEQEERIRERERQQEQEERNRADQQRQMEFMAQQNQQQIAAIQAAQRDSDPCVLM